MPALHTCASFLQQMGYHSLEDFALEQAKKKLLQKSSICIRNIEQIEKKHGIDYANSCKKFTQIQRPIFEKEEDSAEWNAELKQLNILQKRLARLS